jgi:hypothetical protein
MKGKLSPVEKQTASLFAGFLLRLFLEIPIESSLHLEKIRRKLWHV